MRSPEFGETGPAMFFRSIFVGDEALPSVLVPSSAYPPTNLVSNLKVWIFECRDPSYEAFKLGFAAAALLIIAHAITNLLGGCIFVYSKEELEKASTNKQLAIASLIFSWITLAIGFATLATGALSNARSRKTCGVSHHRYLSIGGIACFVHGLFAVAYYISATAVRREEEKLNHQNHSHPHPHPPA